MNFPQVHLYVSRVKSTKEKRNTRNDLERINLSNVIAIESCTTRNDLSIQAASLASLRDAEERIDFYARHKRRFPQD